MIWIEGNLLEVIVLNNPLKSWIIAAVISVLSLIALWLLKNILIRRLAKWLGKNQHAPAIIVDALSKRTHFIFLLILALYLGSQMISLSVGTMTWIRTIALIALLIQLVLWGDALVQSWWCLAQERYRQEDPGRLTGIRLACLFLRFFIIILALLLALDNIPGVQITTLIASLGIGGIAIALAVQNILADLFASLSIKLDKPYLVGDFIIIGDDLGTVEDIGMKTTRIRSLSGEQLIVSNNDLLNSRIRNFKRMQERRVLFTIGVTYQTHFDKLKRVPEAIRAIIESKEGTRFDRSHFKEYGDYALVFETVYFVLDRDYSLFMNIQQEINLEIFAYFQENGIEFAYPTQTVFVHPESSAGRRLSNTLATSLPTD